MYLFVFGLCWVFTAAQPFLCCRRGLLPRAALHHGGWELLPIAGGCSPSWGVRGLLSISGLWGGLLPIAGGCCPPWGWGAALHRGGLGGLLSILGHCSIVVPEPLLLWSPSSGAWLSSCDVQALLPYHMWSLPGPGIKPMPPVLAGWFSATGPPGTSSRSLLMVRL